MIFFSYNVSRAVSEKLKPSASYEDVYGINRLNFLVDVIHDIYEDIIYGKELDNYTSNDKTEFKRCWDEVVTDLLLNNIGYFCRNWYEDEEYENGKTDILQSSVICESIRRNLKSTKDSFIVRILSSIHKNYEEAYYKEVKYITRSGGI